MSDPVKVPEQNGFPTTPGHDGVTKNGPAIGHGKVYAWGWIAGLAVLGLMLWGFFGMNHEKPVFHPVVEPAPAASTMP